MYDNHVLDWQIACYQAARKNDHVAREIRARKGKRGIAGPLVASGLIIAIGLTVAFFISPVVGLIALAAAVLPMLFRK